MRYEHADYKDTDDRGRVTLGTEHANCKVAVAWVRVDYPNPDDDPTPPNDVQKKLNELYMWASDNGHKALDIDVKGGRVYTENAEWVDTEIEGLDE